MTARVPGWSASNARSGLRSMRSRTSSESCVGVRAQVGLQLLAIRRAPGRASRGWPRRRRTPSTSDRLQQRREQRDELGVDGGIVGADRLRPDLPELPVAPGLRALVAEEARQVPELHRLGQLVHAVLDVGAADRRGALRPQRERAPAAVLERVHLLLDDVGGLADAAREQLGPLERRASRCGRSPPARGSPRASSSSGAPPARLLGQHVERPPRGLDLLRHGASRGRARRGTDWCGARRRAW